MSDFTIINGNCLDEMRKLPANSVDAIVSDPPYGLEFMGNEWDRGVPGKDFWVEALRVAKSGAYLLAFSGTRTYHRLAAAIEDAGWEVRDIVTWVSSKTFPKSLDVSKAINKAAGAEREVVGYSRGVTVEDNKGYGGFARGGVGIVQKGAEIPVTKAATDAAKQWSGWGTALKPSCEPICMARKPLEGTVAENVQKYGTGGINIDGCRVPMGDEYDPTKIQRQQNSEGSVKGAFVAAALIGKEIPTYKPGGRWPANLVHDGSPEVISEFPTDKPGKMVRNRTAGARMFNNNGEDTGYETVEALDDPGGSLARFFYCAKISKADRGEGNDHPTVKPTELMRYLVRLVCAKGGTVLDPFMGSGSTGKGALLEDCKFIGIDLNAEYCKIADRRLSEVLESKPASLENLMQ
jgi:site-specific DNA-methyltransferase (adenine-specific)